jgi:asparagine synthase (glutamine-hydrolysing)
MCGIAGFVDYSHFSNHEVLRKMSLSLNHRGPDGEGHLIKDLGICTVGLAHTRLAIVDLTEMGNQPMFLDEFSIVFNGEIYNFKEIRVELELLGQIFNSNSDTEIILHAFKVWGISCVRKFIGMFSFVIFDYKLWKIYLVRDRVGVKPLYYYFDGEILIFGSELKALFNNGKFKKKIDIEGLNSFFEKGYISSPNCIFQSTFKINPGHYLEFSIKTRALNTQCYWDIFEYYKKEKLEINYQVAKENLKKLLISSFNYRLVSDVPVVVLLSSGNDSSILTSILSTNKSSKIKTFTVAFESGNNESEGAKEIAGILEVENIQVVSSPQKTSDHLRDLAKVFDEPFADSSSLPTMIVAQAIRSAGFKVALSADGGDEIFGGYLFYKKFIRLHKILNKYFSSLAMRGIAIFLLKRFLNLKFVNRNISYYSKLEFIIEVLTSKDYSFEFLYKNYSNRKFIKTKVLKSEYIRLKSIDCELQDDISDNLLALDTKNILEGDILVKVDRSMMKYSVESREPLLDHRIIEYAAQLPSKFKYNDKISKFILKDILKEYLPSRIIFKPKAGFTVNLEYYFRNELRSDFEKYLCENSLQKIPYLNVCEILKIKNDYFKYGRNFEILYKVYIFSMWYHEVIISDGNFNLT